MSEMGVALKVKRYFKMCMVSTFLCICAPFQIFLHTLVLLWRQFLLYVYWFTSYVFK